MTRRSVAIAGIVIALGALRPGPVAAQTRSQPDVRFRWALASLTAGRSVPTPITGDVALRNSDRLKIYVSPRSAAFVYVLVEASRGDVSLLFPESFSQFSETYRQGGDYYAPTGEQWLSLDDAEGEHRIHVLASRSRLTALESLVEQSARADSSGRKMLGVKIANEIRSLKTQHRKLQASQSRPLPMGGAVRGEPAIKGMAREIQAHEFFATTYVIGRR